MADKVEALIESQEWLEPLGDQLQGAVTKAFEAGGEAGRQVKNALHGTWLGHPLHAAVTDVPLGAWTAAVVLDAMDSIQGGETYGRAADAAVGIGLAGAAVSALAGVADWSATDGRARKTGLLHGLLNVAGTALFTTSYLMRRRDQREAARGFSMLGYAVAMGAAYLGGHLVYGEQVGVNHAEPGKPLPKQFVPVLAETELAENQPKKVEADGIPIVLVKTDGQICALFENCSHAGGPLSEGKVEGDSIVCPWHGSRFDLHTGKVIDGPATHVQPCFETRVNNGQIEVRGL